MNLFPVAGNRRPSVATPIPQPITYAVMSPFNRQQTVIIMQPVAVPVAAVPVAAVPVVAVPVAVSPFNDWDGAGTIIVEKNYHNSRGTFDTIILFQDHTGNYTITFGRREARHKSPEHTANAETAEESCNLFRFNKDHLQRQYALIYGKNIAYPVCINGSATIRRNTYHSNRTYLLSNKCPYGYKETQSMTRVSISDIIRSGFSHSIHDVDGNMIVIEKRSMGFIKQMLCKGYHTVLLSQPVTLKTRKDDSSSFLNGTIYHY